MNRKRHTAEGGSPQGPKNYSRREAMASVAALALAASTVAADAAELIHPGNTWLADLIQRHREAYAAWDAAIGVRDEAEGRLERSLDEAPICCRLHGREFRINESGVDPLDVAFERTADAVHDLVRTRGDNIADFYSAMSSIRERENENLALLAAGNAELNSRRNLVGLEAAEEAEDLADTLEGIAFRALLMFRPSSLQEVSARLEYLMTETLWANSQPTAEQLRLFLGSMMPAGKSA